MSEISGLGTKMDRLLSAIYMHVLEPRRPFNWYLFSESEQVELRHFLDSVEHKVLPGSDRPLQNLSDEELDTAEYWAEREERLTEGMHV